MVYGALCCADTSPMVAVSKDLFIEQGATFNFYFQWRAASGATTVPRNLTGWIFRMQARASQKSSPILIDASTTNGKITLGDDPNTALANDPTNGWVRISLTDDDTDLLTFKSARYDLEAEDTAGNVYRVLQGNITVSPNITQEADDPAQEG